MNPIRQSFCYPLFQPKEMSMLDLFKRAKAIGYEATELWNPPSDFEEIVATAKQAGLAIASICGHGTLGDGLNRRENHDRIETEISKSLALAVKHGILGLICFSGNRNPGQSDEEAKESTAQGLKRVAHLAEKAGVHLNVELLNSKVDHPGYQCDHTAWGVDVIRRVSSPRVKLLYDIYHMQIMEGDLIRTIRDHIGAIGHFHTAGNPDRRDMDDTQELNYRGICRAISATGYGFFLGHEFSPKRDLIESLRQAHETCRV